MNPMAAADTTHECPKPGCQQRVPFRRLACLRHWRTIPSRGARS